MEMRLEVVVVPVSDVDRAKDFYVGLGWRLDADFVADDGLRVIQLTPPGSPCSVIFGSEVTTATPGSTEGLHLIVDDIEAARADLVGRGVEVSEIFHDVGRVFHHGGRHGTRVRRARQGRRVRQRSRRFLSDPLRLRGSTGRVDEAPCGTYWAATTSGHARAAEPRTGGVDLIHPRTRHGGRQ
jgi:catechol 2,3-dioxygenase-like lactoylglutathione lyase family enzyme